MKFIKSRWGIYVNPAQMQSFQVDDSTSEGEVLVISTAGTDEFELYAVPYTTTAEFHAAKVACDLWLDDLIKELSE